MNTRIVIVLLLVTGCFSDPNPLEEDESGTEESSSSSGSESFATTAAVTTTSTPTTSSTSGSSSGGEESTTHEVSSTDEESSSTTGQETPAYTPCSQTDDPVCPEGETCIWTDGVADKTFPGGFCSQLCNEPGDCPLPANGNAQLICTYYYADPPLQCSLSCADGKTCPEGMECREMMSFPETAGWYTFVCV